MAHNYCPYELVFGKISNLPKQFNSIENIEPRHMPSTTPELGVNAPIGFSY